MNTDDDLRAAWQAEPALRSAGDCPAADELAAGVAGELPSARVGRLVEHLALCAACAEDWRLLSAWRDGAPQRRAQGHRAWLAAAAVLLVAGGVLSYRQLRAPEPAYRAAERAGVQPLVPDGALLPRQRFVLRWQALPQAVEYDVKLFTATLEPLEVRSGLSEPQCTIEAEKLRGVPDGTLLYWQVEAQLEPEGRSVSRAFSVRVGSAAP